MNRYFYRSNGIYVGFINGNYIFSRDGQYLGWIEGDFVWGIDGQFRGKLYLIGEHYYILKYIYNIPPIPKAPIGVPSTPALPAPTSNIASISLKLGFVDAF
ncbi:MAG: hypothetical protein NT149_04620 [Candidatus Gottesmanbacteria bacterium]|nr:hypothetical protein [Candidatus Gottesmanbacteria bacterium]